MSTLSKLFSGYTGGGNVAKNGKFSTTKNNHNRDRYGRPTVSGIYSIRLVKLWLGEDYKDWCQYKIRISKNDTNMPSYMNPIYRQPYHQPKRAYR